MATEIRFAVRRQDRNGKIEWWHWQPREGFDTDWDNRKLFSRKASALAVIWRHRDTDHQGSYKFTLVKVTRRSDAAPKMLEPMAPTQETCVP